MTRALRRLTPKGIDAFRTFLRSIRSGAEFQENPAILYVDGYSAPVVPTIAIDAQRFRSKFDAAAFLVDALRPIEGPVLASDTGVWSWLALFYFDQLSPRGADGKRKPRQDYHYIPGGNGWTRDRHLLAGPYKLVRQHGESARVLLYPPVHEHGTFVYQFGTRQELVSNRGLIDAINLLYWNAHANRPKRGATTETRSGNLRRLIEVLQQFELNYDLQGMSAAELIALLPPEFEDWKPAPATRPRAAALHPS